MAKVNWVAKYAGAYGFYTESDLDSMRAECCSYEYDELCKIGDMCNLLYEGCVGWKHMEIGEVVEYWEERILPDTVDEAELVKMAELHGMNDRIEKGASRPDE